MSAVAIEVLLHPWLQERTVFLAFLPAKLTRRLYSGFIQDEIQLAGDRLRLTIGSKFEHNDYTGFEVQPSVRLADAKGPVYLTDLS